MKNQKLGVLLIMLILISEVFLASCGSAEKQENTGNEVNAGTSSENTEETVTTAPRYSDNLPEFDFNGEKFRILNHESSSWNTILHAETQNGDLLNDAVYLRNIAIEERFNVDITEEKLQGTDGVAAMNQTRKMVLANEDEFDLIMLTDREALQLALENMMLSMKALPYVDITRPYWSQTLNKCTSIGNKLYFSYGDFNITAYHYTSILIFNKVMLESLALDDPYSLVLDNTWTYEKMRGMMNAAVADMNGDGIMDENDRYGYSTVAKHVLPEFWIGAGLTSISKDSDDIPYISMDEKFIGVCMKVFETMYDENVWNEQVTYDTGRVLFYRSTFGGLIGLREVKGLREVEYDFGIIPYPKWTENQESYHARTGGGAFTVVPITASGAVERISVVLEAMACSSKNDVIPVYYETILKDKMTRDAESPQMLDIIFSNRIYDLGDTYWCNQIRDGFIFNLFNSNNRAMASEIEKNRPIIEKAMQNAVDAFAALE